MYVYINTHIHVCIYVECMYIYKYYTLLIYDINYVIHIGMWYVKLLSVCIFAEEIIYYTSDI